MFLNLNTSFETVKNKMLVIFKGNVNALSLKYNFTFSLKSISDFKACYNLQGFNSHETFKNLTKYKTIKKDIFKKKHIKLLRRF